MLILIGVLLVALGLGLGLKLARRRNSGGGGALSGAKLGLNLIDHHRSYGDVPFTDLFLGADDWSYLAPGPVTAALPNANRDATGWAISVPADSLDGRIYTVLHWPLAPCTCDMTWTGTFDSLSVGGAGISLTQTGPQSATITFTKDVTTASNTAVAQLSFVPNAANPPKNIKIIPQGRSGVFTPEFKAACQALTNGGPIRFIKWQPAVERAASPLSVTARNTTSTAMWALNDGVPFDILLQLCAETALDGWFNFGLGESDTVLNQKFALLDAHLAANPSLKAYVQSSNEDWNSVYSANIETLRSWASIDGLDAPAAGAAISSITFSGTTATVTTSAAHGRVTGDFIKLTGAAPAAYNVSGARIVVVNSTSFTYSMASTPATNATTVGSFTYGSDAYGGQIKESAKRSNHVMDLLAAAIDPTRLSRCVRVIGTWNISTSTTDALLAYTGVTSKHDRLATASYWGGKYDVFPQDGTTRAAPNNVQYTTADFDAILADLKTGIDTVIGYASQHRAKAQAVGMDIVDYEFGIDRAFTDLSVLTSWYKSSQCYDATLYAIQQWDALTGGAVANWYVQTGEIFLENNAGRSLQEYLGQTISKANTAKGAATVDYKAGKRLILAPTTSGLSVQTNSANGTVVGTVTWTQTGPTASLSNNALGAFALTPIDATHAQITVADSTKITSAGNQTITVDLTWGAGTNSPLSTNFSVNVYAPFSVNFDFIAGTYNVSGTSYGSLAAVPGYAYSRSDSITVLDSDGTTDSFAGGVVPINGLGLHSYAATVKGNLLSNGSSLDNALWGKVGVTATADTDVAPDGTTSGDTLSAANTNSRINQGQFGGSTYLTTGDAGTLSFFAKRGTATDVKYAVANGSAVAYVGPTSYYSQINSSTWTRVVVQFTVGADGSALCSPLWLTSAAGTTKIWGVQLLKGSFGDGGPLPAFATATQPCDLSFTAPNGTYSVTYTFDDNSTQVVSHAVTDGKFHIDTAPTLNRGRIKSLVI